MGDDSKSLLRDIATTHHTLTHIGWGGMIIRPCGPHTSGAALRALSFPCQHILEPLPVDESSPPQKYGWGGRIRTSVWRDQNPLPFRLATPQHGNHPTKTLRRLSSTPLKQPITFRTRAGCSI